MCKYSEVHFMHKDNYIESVKNTEQPDAKTPVVEPALSSENYLPKPSAIYKKMLIREKYIKNKKRFN